MLRFLAAAITFSLMLVSAEATQSAGVGSTSPIATNERSLSPIDDRLARRNLNAQETVATWTRFAALSGLALGIMSIAVVYGQLRQNTKALNLAASAARMDFVNNRAWVKLKTEGARFIRHPDGVATLSIPLELQNVGRVPASGLTVLVDVGRSVISRSDTEGWLNQLVSQVQLEYDAWQTLFPGETVPHSVNHHLSSQQIGTGAITVLVGALYRSAGDSELRITSSLIRISFRPADANGDVATLLWVDPKASLPAS